MRKINVAVVGATGMVGSKFLEVLTERKLPVENYYLYASAKSAGKEIDFMGKKHTVIELKEENIVDKKIDIALFSAAAKRPSSSPRVCEARQRLVVDNSNAEKGRKRPPRRAGMQRQRTSDGIRTSSPTPTVPSIQAVAGFEPPARRF